MFHYLNYHHCEHCDKGCNDREYARLMERNPPK